MAITTTDTNNSTPQSLSSIITTPALLNIFKVRIPWDPSAPLNWATVRDFASYFDPTTFRAACYPLLVALSHHPLSSIPSLLPLLTDPSSPTFPREAIGLILLLDQAPRQLLDGPAERWTYGFFDILAYRTVNELLALPPTLNPLSRARWINSGANDVTSHVATSYTESHWIYIRFWPLAVLVHAEDDTAHAQAAELIEESRLAVERAEGSRDPYRDCRTEICNDETAFHRRAMMGPPRAAEISMGDFVSWFLMIFETHRPIVKLFGRFPARNGILGRETTGKEDEFLERTNRFGCVRKEVEKMVKEDVKNGVWKPLEES